MCPQSEDITSKTYLHYSQYNKLRADLLDDELGHDHLEIGRAVSRLASSSYAAMVTGTENGRICVDLTNDTIWFTSNGELHDIRGYTGITGYTGYLGPTGYTGFTGPQGVTGYTGYTGIGGVASSTGATGYTGYTGPIGYTGPDGSASTTGATGYTGYTGYTGPEGTASSTGSTGYTGYSGPTGYTGAASSVAGPTGYTGFTGRTGYTGYTGYRGVTGYTGETGYTGTTGYTGYTGSPGSATNTGATGYTGYTGYTGPDGSASATGATGYTGYTGPAHTGTIVLTAAGSWPSATGGCAVATQVETTTYHHNYFALDFDTATDESAEWVIAMPSNWNAGTITAIFYWTALSGSGTVKWYIQGTAYGNGDILDAAWGTAVGIEDTLVNVGEVHISDVTGAITIAGAAGELLNFKAYRDTSEDTLSADARLLAIKIAYTVV
jgi:hypothetical protein